MNTSDTSIFRPGENCWQHERAGYASLIIDCANYYMRLHEALGKAKHSIFIVGWDIDSRVELLRGPEAAASALPVNLFDLLTLKAQENPDLQIYLNRWSYALFMADSREPLAAHKWAKTGLANIHFCKDDQVPSGACHHQKVIVVDDEVAFCGGMDIALDRWDLRDHSPKDDKRQDPGGFYSPDQKHSYGPYHDIQSVVSGCAAQILAGLVRERWKIATGIDAVPRREVDCDALPPSWPSLDEAQFKGIEIGVARTLPVIKDAAPAFDIDQMYLDEIGRAEKFIYIENQYLTRKSVAEALVARMFACPDLRVLILSSYDPQNIIEQNSMWVGRILFRKIVRNHELARRCMMAYPLSRENGVTKTVRIHSKVMIVDDKFLHVGSANLNNRSMRIDTECDLVFEASTDEHRRKIADLRNDLIREHTGREANGIQAMIDASVDAGEFTKEVAHSTQHIAEITDEEFTSAPLAFLGEAFGDPESGFFEKLFAAESVKSNSGRLNSRAAIAIGIAIALIAVLALAWKATPLADIDPAGLAHHLSSLHGSMWSYPLTFAAFIVAGLLFAPVTVLIAGVAIAFGPVEGFFISLVGGLGCAALGYAIGRAVKPDRFGEYFKGKTEKLKERLKTTGIASIAFLRMLPVAPFTLINLSAGMLRVPFGSYLIGSLLGLLPGMIVISYMGDSIDQLWKDPSLKTSLEVGACIAAWVAVTLGANRLFNRWQNRAKAAAA